MSDWTRSQTISPPDKITIKYYITLPDGTRQEKTESLTSTSKSDSVITYRKLSYIDARGVKQEAEVVALKEDVIENTIASVNQSYVSFRLSKGQGLPLGGARAENITTSEYDITESGPVLKKETSLNYNSMAQFSGGLQVEDYTGFQPSGSEMILTHKTERVITLLKGQDGRDITKTETSRWMARGVTSEGATDFATAYKKARALISDQPSIIKNLVVAFTGLIFEGTEVQIETGRIPASVKPPDQAIAAEKIRNFDGSPAEDRTINTGFSYTLVDGESGGGGTTTASYAMPLAPDDYYAFADGEQVLIPGGASNAAENFLKAEALLDFGHAYGQNIVTGWNEFPSLDMSPVYIQIEGTEAAFLTDATSYAWDSNGMVVSSDLMLLGVSGWYGASSPSASWAQLPVPIAGLSAVSAGLAGTASKANSIAIPAGFDPLNPGPVLAALPTSGTDAFATYRISQRVVKPALVIERVQIATGPAIEATEFDYPLVLPVEEAQIATGGTVEQFAGAVLPAMVVGVTPLAPAVTGGRSAVVPAAVVSVTPLAPAVVSGGGVVVPAAVVAVSGVAPEQVGAPRTEVKIPAAQVGVMPLPPAVAGGASVAVPAAVVAVNGVAPEQVGSKSLIVSMIAYSQSSLWPGTAPASNSIMTDGSITNTGAATNVGNPPWIQMDLGDAYQIAQVIIGTATSSIPGGWNRGYTSIRDVQYSTDGTTWTTSFNTGALSADGIYTFNVNFIARYIRILGPSGDYVAISEFYALEPGQSYP